MGLRVGVHHPLEQEANRLIRESLKGVTKHSDKADILTPWKERERHLREVYVTTGVPDPAIRKGMYNRVMNPDKPELNSREGHASARAWKRGMATRRHGSSKSLAEFVESQGTDFD